MDPEIAEKNITSCKNVTMYIEDKGFIGTGEVPVGRGVIMTPFSLWEKDTVRDEQHKQLNWTNYVLYKLHYEILKIREQLDGKDEPEEEPKGKATKTAPGKKTSSKNTKASDDEDESYKNYMNRRRGR